MKASIAMTAIMTAMSAALGGMACLASAAPAKAQEWRPSYQRPAPGFIAPPYDAYRVVRAMGFSPVGRPIYRRGVYVLRALDRHGEMVRVVVDAQAARIVSVMPAARLVQNAPPYQRRYDSGPPPSDPRGMEPDPRYAPAPGPYYESPQGAPEEAWPDDDDDEGLPFDVPDDDDEDDDARIRSLPPREAMQAPGGQLAPARSAAVTPARTLREPPLPRPRPQQIVRAETPEAGAAQSAAPGHSEMRKPEIRVIEIKKPDKPEPRI